MIRDEFTTPKTKLTTKDGGRLITAKVLTQTFKLIPFLAEKPRTYAEMGELLGVRPHTTTHLYSWAACSPLGRATLSHERPEELAEQIRDFETVFGVDEGKVLQQ